MVLLSKKLTRLTNIQLKQFIIYKNSKNGTETREYITKTANSYISYCLAIENYFKERFNLSEEELKNFNFCTLNIEDLASYRSYIEGLGLQKASANQKLVCLSAFLKYLLKSNNISSSIEEDNHLKELINSLKGRGVVKSTDRLVFTKKDIFNLNKFIVNSKLANRERALVMFLIIRDTLCNRDDLIDIKVSDINLEDANPYILMYFNGNSTPQKFLLKQDTVLAINRYLTVREEESIKSDYLFTSNRSEKVSSPLIYYIFKEIFINAGFGYLDSDGEMKTDYTIQSLRWSFKNVL